MEIVRSVTVPGPPEVAFEWLDDLGRYPTWMPLVHAVEPIGGDASASWEVELQAQVGPFARSKRLRMERSLHEPPRRVVFERAERDGRSHASWVLVATVDPVASASSEVTMSLSYGGRLWTGAVLQRVLDDHVERGAEALQQLVAERA